ncbi:MAG: 50S ribosomal protein L11 methyltransferase [Pseudomonadota bacterium]
MSDADTDWLSLTLNVQPDRLDAIEALLWSLGAVSVSVVDAADQPILEPGPGQTPLWSQLQLQALFAIDQHPDALLLALHTNDEQFGQCRPRLQRLAGQHWTRAWMDRYEPLSFGHGLWICPSHLEPDPSWDTVIRLDPGLAFGSGTHPTTALCLKWLAKQELRARRVIDYGCGSGILAIAAALKGAASVLAIDHDPQALEATRANAERNGVADCIETRLPQAEPLAAVDLVLANILAGPLIDLAPRLIAALRSGGRLVLSGVLAEQADAVAQAYRVALGADDRALQEEWVRMVFGPLDQA